MKKCHISILDTENPFSCGPAYQAAGYPSQECLPDICLTHTERDEGEPFVPVPEEPVLLPDCIVIAYPPALSGTQLTLTGTEYEGTNSMVKLDASDTWCLLASGEKYVQSPASDIPIGVFVSLSGESITTVDCDNFQGTTGTVGVDCVNLAFTTLDGIPQQDFPGSGTSYVGELGGGALTFVGTNWEWAINGLTFIGGSDPNDPQGLFELGDDCALFKPCVDEAIILPPCIEAGLADDLNIVGIEWNYNNPDYVSLSPLVSDLTYTIGVGWTVSFDDDNDVNTAPILYTKVDDPFDPSNPIGLYSTGASEMLIRECN